MGGCVDVAVACSAWRHRDERDTHRPSVHTGTDFKACASILDRLRCLAAALAIVGVLIFLQCFSRSHFVELDDVKSATLDQLIAELPVEDDWIWDQATDSLILDPVVAELKDRLARGVQLSDDQWRAALLRSRAVQLSDLWLEGSSCGVCIRIPEWLGSSRIYLRERGKLRDQTQGGALFSNDPVHDGSDETRLSSFLPLGFLEVGEHLIALNIVVLRAEGPPPSDGDGHVHAPSGILWEGSFEGRTKVLPITQDVIRPISSKVLDHAVRSAVAMFYEHPLFEEESRRVAMIGLDPEVPSARLLDSIALSLQIEVLKNGRVVQTLDLLTVGPDMSPQESRARSLRSLAGACVPLSSIPRDLNFSDRAAEWSVRIRGTDRDVERLLTVRAWWKGDIELPCRRILRLNPDEDVGIGAACPGFSKKP